MMTLLEATALVKTFHEGPQNLTILNGLSLAVPEAKKIGIVGASGAGKSTLLHILGGMDAPTGGEVTVEGKKMFALSENQRAGLRNRFFGFVFQFYHLLAELTALENVAVPAMIAGISLRQALQMAGESLKRVGLENRGKHLPSELSGGEMQRVAIARAAVLQPKVILADEPTGNLDEETGREVLKFLFDSVEGAEGSLILVTHNRELLKNLDAVYELKHGTLHPLS